MTPSSKLFLVTRADLSTGQQAVQLAHALREFTELFPEVDSEWYRTSNTLALLEVPDEQALKSLLNRALSRGIPSAPFAEPDRDFETTAVALGPTAKKLCRGLPVAFRERRCA